LKACHEKNKEYRDYEKRIGKRLKRGLIFPLFSLLPINLALKID